MAKANLPGEKKIKEAIKFFERGFSLSDTASTYGIPSNVLYAAINHVSDASGVTKVMLHSHHSQLRAKEKQQHRVSKSSAHKDKRNQSPHASSSGGKPPPQSLKKRATYPIGKYSLRSMPSIRASLITTTVHQDTLSKLYKGPQLNSVQLKKLVEVVRGLKGMGHIPTLNMITSYANTLVADDATKEFNNKENAAPESSKATEVNISWTKEVFIKLYPEMHPHISFTQPYRITAKGAPKFRKHLLSILSSEYAQSIPAEHFYSMDVSAWLNYPPRYKLPMKPTTMAMFGRKLIETCIGKKHDPEAVLIFECVSAAGQQLDPYVIFSDAKIQETAQKKMQNSKLAVAASFSKKWESATGVFSTIWGKDDENVFKTWLHNSFIPQMAASRNPLQTRVLLLPGNRCNLDVSLVRECLQLNIVVLYLPPYDLHGSTITKVGSIGKKEDGTQAADYLVPPIEKSFCNMFKLLGLQRGLQKSIINILDARKFRDAGAYLEWYLHLRTAVLTSGLKRVEQLSTQERKAKERGRVKSAWKAVGLMPLVVDPDITNNERGDEDVENDEDDDEEEDMREEEDEQEEEELGMHNEHSDTVHYDDSDDDIVILDSLPSNEPVYSISKDILESLVSAAMNDPPSVHASGPPPTNWKEQQDMHDSFGFSILRSITTPKVPSEMQPTYSNWIDSLESYVKTLEAQKKKRRHTLGATEATAPTFTAADHSHAASIPAESASMPQSQQLSPQPEIYHHNDNDDDDDEDVIVIDQKPARYWR